MLIGAPLGILLGMAAALNRNTWIDYLASTVATLGLTIPVFVISMLLILIFAVWLNWLPASGWPQAQALDPAHRRLCGDPLGDLCALYALGDARHAQPALRHGAARQGAERAPYHFPACAAQFGDPDGHGVPAHVHRYGHRLDLRRSHVPRAGARRLLRLLHRGSATITLEMALMLMITLMYCVAYLLSDIAYALLNPRIRVGGAE